MFRVWVQGLEVKGGNGFRVKSEGIGHGGQGSGVSF